MARKKKHEEHENHERWLVSYADFITLLFAFFVVMYSISSVNEGKYRVLSDAIVAAFRSQDKSIRPIQIGEPTRAPKSTQMEMQKSPGLVKTPNPPIQMMDKVMEEMKTSGKLTKEEEKLLELIKKLGGLDALEKLRGLANMEGLDELLKKAGLEQKEQQKLLNDQEMQAIKDGLKKLADVGGLEGLEKLAELGGLKGLEELAKIGGLEGLEKLISAAGSEGGKKLEKIADDIERAMSPLIQKDLISIDRSDQWIEVEINTSILYPSGSAHLQPEAAPVLKDLARILRDFPNPMRIEGFTDNVPINTLVYPSNWELSTARASRVVRLFTAEGIHPERMAAIGYGEYRPIADNANEAGRSKNRRVVLVILANHDVEDLFNSGVLKSGQRTAGFNQPGGQPADTVRDLAKPPAPAGQRKETGTAPIQAIAKPIELKKPINDVVKALPPLPKTEQPPVVPAKIPAVELPIPATAAEPSVTKPVTDRPPVFVKRPAILPLSESPPKNVGGGAPVIKKSIPPLVEPAISIPSPILMPPIKFVPLRETNTGSVQSIAKPVEIRKPDNDAAKMPSSLPKAEQSPVVSTKIPATTESDENRPPVFVPRPAILPAPENTPNIVGGGTSAIKQPTAPPLIEPAINIPSPILLPPIKFSPSASGPMGGVVIGNAANTGAKK